MCRFTLNWQPQLFLTLRHDFFPIFSFGTSNVPKRSEINSFIVDLFIVLIRLAVEIYSKLKHSRKYNLVIGTRLECEPTVFETSIKYYAETFLSHILRGYSVNLVSIQMSIGEKKVPLGAPRRDYFIGVHFTIPTLRKRNLRTFDIIDLESVCELIFALFCNFLLFHNIFISFFSYFLKNILLSYSFNCILINFYPL